jgi:DNA polymerase III delta prime subunit
MEGIMRYSPGMEKLTVDTLRTLARAQGLELTDAELTALLPLVEGGRKSLAAIRDLPVESEPASQFRVF